MVPITTLPRRVLGFLARQAGLRRIVAWCRRNVCLTRTRRVYGVPVRIPSIRGISCDATEPWMTELLARVLPDRGGVFLDVGANAGQTLVKVRVLGVHPDLRRGDYLLVPRGDLVEVSPEGAEPVPKSQRGK